MNHSVLNKMNEQPRFARVHGILWQLINFLGLLAIGFLSAQSHL